MLSNIKTTLLFSSVQLLNILSKLILNKAAAVFIGTDGFGVVGILQSTLEMVKTFFGFGVAQGTTQEVAKNLNSINVLDQTISSSKNLSLLLGTMAGIFTYYFSDVLSELSFRNIENSYLFEFLSIIVFIGIVADVQLAILRGMRKLKDLALATIIGAFLGTIVGVTTYSIFGYDGIIGVFLASAISALVFSTYFLKKNYTTLKNPVKKYFFNKASNIFKLGFFLMLITFFSLLSEYIIKSYIGNHYGLDAVGIYQVGLIIVSGYFGIFITAMMTDFYPKISSLHNDDLMIEKELNQQVLSSLLLIGPFLVVFVFFQPYLIEILFSAEFSESSQYVYLALFGTLLIVVSNPVDIILLVKDRVKLLFIISIFYRIVGVTISITLFDSYNLYGLGCAYFLMSTLHFVIMKYAVSKLFGINLYKQVLEVLLVIFIILAVSYITILVDIHSIEIYLFQIILVIFMLYYCNYQFKKNTNQSLFELVRYRIKKNGK